MESLVAPLFNSNIGDKSLISRTAILTRAFLLADHEWSIDQEIDVGKNIVDGRDSFLYQLLDRKSGIYSYMNTLALQPRYNLGNGFGLVEWLSAKNGYTVVLGGV